MVAIRRQGMWIAATGALLAAAQLFIEPARLAGSFDGIFDPALTQFYLGSDAGTAGIVRIIGMLAVLFGFRSRHSWLAIAGAALTCLSFTFMGHTVTRGERFLVAPLLLTHIVIIAFWFGSLRALRRTNDFGHADIAGVLERFSRVASIAVPILFAAGLGLAISLLSSLAALFTPYGLMILTKYSGFGVLIAMASINRWRLLPRIRAGDATAVIAFQRIAGAEWLIMVALIFVTVTVTSLFSPDM
jgi:putative copper export protein